MLVPLGMSVSGRARKREHNRPRARLPHSGDASYESVMFSRPRILPASFIAPCLPTNAPTPSGAEWLTKSSLMASDRSMIMPELSHPDTPNLGGNIMELTTALQAIGIIITGVLIYAGITYVAAAVRRPPQ